MLTEAGTSVRLSIQSRSLLLLADESSGVTVRMKLFRDFNLLADTVVRHVDIKMYL